ncbi:hypothetical protein L5515_019339 [Caenorhabditis briggsae]|uniref:Uncharacterized protein n=1 Tax=Caenorhabditis briggsae TaxID=6238 RepID=A0AAE9FLH8_CAEBR|nr:hypothetical protein L5515_019339 [Caenorhabditis briggsae]
MQPSKAYDNNKKRNQDLTHSASRQKRNEHFLKELAEFRYGDTEEQKERYDKIGEKFTFWKALTNEQKRRCAVDHSAKMRYKTWNTENGITISEKEKQEFLRQRKPLDKITLEEKLDCLFYAKNIEKSRVHLIENPLEAAFSKFSTNFEQFDRVTRDVPESDIYINAWFKKRAAELHERTSEMSDEIQIIGTVLQTPLANGFSSINSTLSTAMMRDVIHQAHHPQIVVPERRERQYSTLKAKVQARRKEVDSGQKPLDLKIIAAHLAKIKQKAMAGNASGNVPSTASLISSTGNGSQPHNDSTRSIIVLEEEFLSGNNGSSSSNQIPSFSGQVAVRNQQTSSPSALNTTRQATHESRSASHSQRAAPKPKAPAPSFNFTQTDATVGRNAGEHIAINAPSCPIEIECDAPQAPAPSSNTPYIDGTSPNIIDESIDRIVRDEETNVGVRSTRKRVHANESMIDQTENDIGDTQRAVSKGNSRSYQTGNVTYTSTPLVFTVRRDVLAEKATATSSNPPPTNGIQDSVRDGMNAESSMNAISRFATNVSRSSSSRMEEPVERNSLLLKIVENTSAGGNLLMNNQIGIYNDFPQGFFSVPDYSHLSASRRDNQPSNSAWYPNLEVPQSYFSGPANLGYNLPSSSSQASTSSLPNPISSDNMTHKATLSIAPPPRMMSSIMNHLSTQMKKREDAPESVGLDFGPIQVKLKAPGKELDETIAFLNNLKAQLESAKQRGSYQQF